MEGCCTDYNGCDDNGDGFQCATYWQRFIFLSYLSERNSRLGLRIRPVSLGRLTGLK